MNGSLCLSDETILQSLWFLSWFPWERNASNKEATEPRVHSGSDEIITSKCYGRHYDLVNRTEYLCHKWPRMCPVLFVVITFPS
jgi:hypothetical protein